MSGWDGAKIGVKVKPEYRALANQFLKSLIESPENQPSFNEEIGTLNYGFKPDVSINIDHSNRVYGIDIFEALEKHNENYCEQFDFFGGKKKTIKSISVLDSLYDLMNKLFSPACLLHMNAETQ